MQGQGSFKLLLINQETGEPIKKDTDIHMFIRNPETGEASPQHPYALIGHMIFMPIVDGVDAVVEDDKEHEAIVNDKESNSNKGEKEDV